LNFGPGDADLRTVIGQAREIAVRHDGYTIIDAAPPGAKASLDVFGPPRSDFAIMRRLKEQFDPHRTLSPGRFAGRL
jgi:glycolate oxidase FAD binding subunit